MKEYVIHELDCKAYNGLLLCLSYDSIMNYLDDIEREPLIANNKGNLLIDQLLVTGNGKNRFIICPYNHGKLNTAFAESIQPDKYYKKESIKILQENYNKLNNSILTDEQRETIKEGNII